MLTQNTCSCKFGQNKNGDLNAIDFGYGQKLSYNKILFQDTPQNKYFLRKLKIDVSYNHHTFSL